MEIYELSKQPYLFKKKLEKHHIILSNKFFNILTSNKIKDKAQTLFQFFSSNHIKIIPIHSENYPKELYHIDMPPLCLFVYGNIQEIHKKMVYIYDSKEFSHYARNIYKIMSDYVLSKNCNLIGLSDDNSNSKVVIKRLNYFNVSSTIQYIKNLSSNKTTIFLFHHSTLYEFYFLSCLSKIVIIPEASYEQAKTLKIIIDSMIEQGKEILVIPGNIYNKNTYFSNYLLKEGANILLTKYDIDNYL
ncbi:MAG: DNA-processing protein DprA [Clostridia bacterium]|nr:DNA-processing protein DprA [Clostridia bacterium]